MKKTLTELFDECEPKELDEILPDAWDVTMPEGAGERIQQKVWKKIVSSQRRKKLVRRRFWLRAAAACLILAVGLAGAAYAVEAREYKAAVQFFDENGLSAEGLSREEVKAVYQDITTQQFTYDKTAEVIERSVSGPVAGVEIFQKEPTPEDLAALWNHKKRNTEVPGDEIAYRCYPTEKLDEVLGFDVHDKSYLERYEDGKLVWTAEFSKFQIEDCTSMSTGAAVWGRTPTISSEQTSYGWVAAVNSVGTVLWEKQMDHGFRQEDVAAVLDNEDGTWAVISRGDLQYLCLSQYSESGEELSFQKTQVGNYGIWNAVRLGDGYLIQLGNSMEGEHARLAKLDRDGSLTDSFVYDGQDCYYYLVDMLEFQGQVYLSAYSTPKLENEEQNAGGRYEIAEIVNELFDNNIWEIASEELTPMVRKNYTAVLLACDPKGGTPETFYAIKGSLGGKLAVSENGKLLWDVESIVSTYFSPATSAFSIGGTSQVYRYTFDGDGTLLRQEDTGETADYYR
ncbi:hypothetical protein [Hominifimenecus sp. rT4P-3]|uniref:hypothetical protein n=1 Tax=Hominifimenecus sp. rT4P-3 TaxID=3242979 RepID=UPI003DA48D74